MFAAKAAMRAFGAALAVTCAMWGSPLWAQQPADAKSEVERLLRQKSMMLEAYLASKKVVEAVNSGDQKGIEAVDRARADLAEGVAALGKGELTRADQSLNAGLRQISALMLQQGTRAANPAAKKTEFQSRRTQIDSFIKSLEAGSDAASPGPWTARLTVAKKGLEQADALFAEDKFTEANARLVSIYEEVVVIVSEARRNQSIIYQLHFATPADEFKYELNRNKSYEVLVDIALGEKENPDKDLHPYIRKLVEQSRELREQASTQATSGDHVTAIGTLENATKLLVKALRSAGVMVME